MEKTNTIDFAELLEYAETLGYKWNDAHDILNDYYPEYGAKVVDINCVEEDDDEDVKKILGGFFKAENVQDFTILPKSC